MQSLGLLARTLNSLAIFMRSFCHFNSTYMTENRETSNRATLLLLSEPHPLALTGQQHLLQRMRFVHHHLPVCRDYVPSMLQLTQPLDIVKQSVCLCVFEQHEPQRIIKSFLSFYDNAIISTGVSSGYLFCLQSHPGFQLRHPPFSLAISTQEGVIRHMLTHKTRECGVKGKTGTARLPLSVSLPLCCVADKTASLIHAKSIRYCTDGSERNSNSGCFVWNRAQL